MADLPAASALAAAEGIFSTSVTYYLSLHTADPGTTGASEVTGGSYARQAITFAVNGSSNGLVSSNAQAFTGMPAESGNLYIGVWTAATSGTFKAGDPTAAVTGPVAAGATVNFASGAVTVGIS